MYTKNKIWEKIENETAGLEDLAVMKKLCNDATALMKTARDTFPRYTLHDEVHIQNVLTLMESLLGDEGILHLTLGECEMLILSACYHDVGMCYSKEQKEKELRSNRFEKYLDKHPKAFLQAEEARRQNVQIPEEVLADYFRSIHHIRVMEMLPESLQGTHVRRDYLADVCKSHAENVEDLHKLSYDSYLNTDCVFCAVILRLADILDFDFTRTPEVLYHFQKIVNGSDAEADKEWKKHLSAYGFKFACNEERTISFRAVCEDMQNEFVISRFLDYTEEELRKCSEVLGRDSYKWKNFQLPAKIERNIERKGYQSGEYRLTLDAERVIQLLVGDNIYISDEVFLRELLQNAFDAVRVRRMFDGTGGIPEKTQVEVSSWMDQGNNQWFRIDDCGIGMTEQAIMEYFLKVGRSYYRSDEFKQRCRKYKSEYMPISQFGIGILSCFLKGDRLEISTRHYEDRNGIRFGMYGLSGYYSIAEEEKGDRGSSMPSAEKECMETYRQRPGTSVAVRMKEPVWKRIDELIKQYVCFPDLKIRYKDGNRWINNSSQQELLQLVKEMRSIRIPLPKEYVDEIKSKMPLLEWEDGPYISVHCVPLDEISNTAYISGADIKIALEGKHNGDEKRTIFGMQVSRELNIALSVTKSGLEIYLSFVFHKEVKKENACGREPVSDLLDELWVQYIHKSDFAQRCAESLMQGQIDVCFKGEGYHEKEIIRDMIFLWKSNQMKNDKVYIKIPFSIHPKLKTIEKTILSRYFMSIRRYNNLTEFVYNGIRVGDYADSSLKDCGWFRYTVILLSGKFQPVLGISRERIQYIPLKAAAYIEILGSKIRNCALSCEYLQYSELELRDYDIILKDSVFQSMAEESLGAMYGLSIKSIKEKLEAGENNISIGIGEFSYIFQIYHEPFVNFYLSVMLLRVFLQKDFNIRWCENCHGHMKFLITAFRDEEFIAGERFFCRLCL